MTEATTPTTERNATIQALADALRDADERKADTGGMVRDLIAREAPASKREYDQARERHQRAVAARNVLYDTIQTLPEELRQEILRAARA